jgi:hypothetical protein
MLGGAPASIQNLIASDIEFRLNNVSKPLAWMNSSWTVNNLFELKNAQRALVDQNVFENNWAAAQNGFAILFTPRGEDGAVPQATAADVTFTNNIVRHSAGGFNIAGPDDTSPSQPSQRILIKNNLIDDINGPKYGANGADGRAFQTVGGPVNITIDHNTVFETGAIIVADVAPSLGFVFRNNIVLQGDYGVLGSGHGTGLEALAFYYPGYEFRRNVVIGAPSSDYPPDNFYPASINLVLFVDFANGNYRLAPGSQYINQGTDGKDVGCDFTALGR